MLNLKRSSWVVGALGLAICFAIYKLIAYLYVFGLLTYYKSYMPESFEIERGVFAGDRIGGFLEGCGVGIFLLSEGTSRDISEGGIGFLNKSSRTIQSRDRHYQEWRQTPIAPQEYTVFQKVAMPDAGGHVCAEVSESLTKKVLSASRNAGTFYSGFNKNSELVVIPSLRLAVFSHDR